MKTEIVEIRECNCGAITVMFEDGMNCSMKRETLYDLVKYGVVKTDVEIGHNKLWYCNHCVNNWGIDLCGCGSGEPIGKCEECGFPEMEMEEEFNMFDVIVENFKTRRFR